MLATSELKNEALTSLLGIIDSIRGNKVLILDKGLLSTLSLVTTFSTLKEHGIKHIVWLQSSNLESVSSLQDINAIIYLSSTDFHRASMIASHAQTVISSSTSLDVNLVLVPEKTLAFNQVLEESSILGDLTIHAWPVYFLPIADDLLSLNLPNGGFRDTYLDDLTSAIYLSAEAIQDLQLRYGLVGRVTGKGEAAHKLAELLLRNRHARRTQLANDDTGDTDSSTKFDHKFSNIFVGQNIDQLIIVDRQTDPLTPLLSQLTYHGLIDEFYGVSDFGQVELPASIVTPTKDGKLSNTKKSVTLGASEDKLFNEIRDLNFAVVGQSLNKVARQLQSDYDQRHEAQTVSEIKQFVAKLGGLQTVHQSLRFHTALAEDLMSKVQSEEFNKWLEVQQNLVADSMDLVTLHNMIEDLIDRGSNLSMILRLLSIECLCNGGIKSKDLQFFKKEILQTYGHQHLLTFNRLERLGLVYARAPTVPNYFSQVRKQLNLITEQESDVPKDISFAYSGYAPLSVRLVQCVIDKKSIVRPKRFQNETITNGGWKGVEDVLKYMPGPSFDEMQRSESNVREGKLRKILLRNSPGHDKPTTMVFYLGGITHAEISALRFVAKKVNTRIVIATTGIISGDKISDIACSNNSM